MKIIDKLKVWLDREKQLRRIQKENAILKGLLVRWAENRWMTTEMLNEIRDEVKHALHHSKRTDFYGGTMEVMTRMDSPMDEKLPSAIVGGKFNWT